MKNFTPQARVVIELTPDDLQELIRQGVANALGNSSQTHRLPQDATNDWLTREETANLLHVSFPTLRRYEKQKILVPRRIGRRVLYSRKDVEAKLQEGYSTNERRHRR